LKDLRKYAKQTNFILLFGGILFIILVGEVLLLLFWGIDGAIGGIVCFLLGLFPILLIIGLIYLLEWIYKRFYDN